MTIVIYKIGDLSPENEDVKVAVDRRLYLSYGELVDTGETRVKRDCLVGVVGSVKFYVDLKRQTCGVWSKLGSVNISVGYRRIDAALCLVGVNALGSVA